VAAVAQSHTGRYLRPLLAAAAGDRAAGEPVEGRRAA
jgi:hypothetical protein